MAITFEGYERRIEKITAKLAEYGIGSLEEAKAICDKAGINVEAIEKGVQLLQLPCPEFMLYGARRWGHVKDQFDNPFFRAQCRSMLEPIMLQLQEYASEPERFCLLGITAVEGSPSCGASRTCRAADWGGEFDGKVCDDLAASVREASEPGVFMEVISKMLAENGLELPLLSISKAKEQIEKVLG